MGLGVEGEKWEGGTHPRPLSLAEYSRQLGPGPWSTAASEQQTAEKVTEQRVTGTGQEEKEALQTCGLPVGQHKVSWLLRQNGVKG